LLCDSFNNRLPAIFGYHFGAASPAAVGNSGTAAIIHWYMHMHTSLLYQCICTRIVRAMKKLNRIGLCNCFAARQAARHLTKLYERHLGKAELTSAQFSILVGLEEAGELTMNELAGAMVMDRTTLLRAIQPLQRQDLLAGRPSADDGRRLVLSLSTAGKKRLKKAFALWSDAQRELESMIGAGEAARLRRDLLGLVRAS